MDNKRNEVDTLKWERRGGGPMIQLPVSSDVDDSDEESRTFVSHEIRPGVRLQERWTVIAEDVDEENEHPYSPTNGCPVW